MTRRPSMIFYGPQIAPQPEEPNMPAINRDIAERQNQIQAKWDQFARFSSPLVKKLVETRASDLERIDQRNRGFLAGREIMLKVSQRTQLGQAIAVTNPAPELPEPTKTRPGAGKYAKMATKRTHSMITRSQEKFQNEKFRSQQEIL